MATWKGMKRIQETCYVVSLALLSLSSGFAAEESPPVPLRLSPGIEGKPPSETVISAPQLAGPNNTAATPIAALPPITSRPAAVIRREYRMGPDDLVEIQVFGAEQMSRTVRINTSGQIALPLVGSIVVGGLTTQEAEAAVSAKLAENLLQNPQVSIFIKEYTSQRITVEGAVNHPGIYPLRGPTTLLQALALAGGQGSLSDMSEVMLFRANVGGGRDVRTFDVEKIRAGQLEDPAIANDDVVVVKRSPKRAALKDSLFRDILDTLNPFKW